MLILLPPSEGKAAPRRGRPLDLADLSFPQLREAREQTLRTVVRCSGADDAARVLGIDTERRAAGPLSPQLADQVGRNTRLATEPTAPAHRIYTGVLYAALGWDTLEPAARRRAARRLVTVSALFGAVRPGDRIPAYRLSMKARLPGFGPLAAWWRPHLAEVLTAEAGDGCVVDLRSAGYVAAWSPPVALRHNWIRVAVPGASHGAKHTRGLVARALVESVDRLDRPEDVAAVLAERFDVLAHPPTTPSAGWQFDVLTRDRS